MNKDEFYALTLQNKTKKYCKRGVVSGYEIKVTSTLKKIIKQRLMYVFDSKISINVGCIHVACSFPIQTNL